MGIGQRLKRLRTQRNLTQEALSELTGRKVSQGAIAALESRDSESSRFVPDLAAALKVAPSALLSDKPEEVSPAPERTGRVPLISWVQAGDWAHAADLLQPGEGFEWIDTSVTVRPHTFALRVEGDSMEPEFVAGTVLVVEPEMEAYPGDFVIAKNGDEATFKQLVRDGADLYLKPLNQRYPIKPLGTARIVGVVREAVKRYR